MPNSLSVIRQCFEFITDNTHPKVHPTNKTKMTAQQARQQTEANLLTNTDGEYQSILKNIEQEVKKGNFELVIYKSISKTTRQKLEKDGFNCSEFFDPRDHDVTFNVKW